MSAKAREKLLTTKKSYSSPCLALAKVVSMGRGGAMKNKRKTLSIPADVAALVPEGFNVSAWVSDAICLCASLPEGANAAYLRALADAQRGRVDRAARELTAQGLPPELVAQLATGLAVGDLRDDDRSPRPVIGLVRILLEESLIGGMSDADSITDARKERP